MNKLLARIDRFQQDHRWAAFPFAVIKKFGDDRAGNLAALIAYYGFFSLFPLLLVFVSILGLVLRGDSELQARIVNSALAQFPIIGDTLRKNVAALSNGAGVTLGIGTVAALWAGLGVTQAAQNALNDIWGVPLKERPNFVKRRVRGLLMLVVLGTLILGSTFLSGLGTATGALGGALRVVGFAGSVVLNLVAFTLAYMVLTDRDLGWRDVFAGAVFAAVAWGILQAVGSFYVSHSLKNSTAVYGFFGVVLGLLAWIYLGAQVLLYGAEINVVRKRHLWPRSLSPPPLSQGDERTFEHTAKVEERVPQERVDVEFETQGAKEPQLEDEVDPASNGQERAPRREAGRPGRMTGLGALVALIFLRGRRRTRR